MVVVGDFYQLSRSLKTFLKWVAPLSRETTDICLVDLSQCLMAFIRRHCRYDLLIPWALFPEKNFLPSPKVNFAVFAVNYLNSQCFQNLGRSHFFRKSRKFYYFLWWTLDSGFLPWTVSSISAVAWLNWLGRGWWEGGTSRALKARVSRGSEGIHPWRFWNIGPPKYHFQPSDSSLQ